MKSRGSTIMRLPKNSTRTLTATLGLALAVTLAACGNSHIDGPGNVEDVAEKFGACSGPAEVWAPANEGLLDTPWLKLPPQPEGFKSPRSENPDEPATFPTLTVETSQNEIHEQELEVLDTFWPGIDWAWESGATVWLGLYDDVDPDVRRNVGLVMIVPHAGDVFFAGNCQNLQLTQPIHETLGDDTNEILAKLPTMTPQEQHNALRIEDPQPEPTPEPGNLILNPEDVGPEVLDPLDSVGVYINITERMKGNPTVCTKIDIGWNDCTTIGADFTEDGMIGAFLDPRSRRLEFWLADEAPTPDSVYGLLGVIDIPAGRDPVRVEINTTDLTRDELSPEKDPQRVRLLEVGA